MVLGVLEHRAEVLGGRVQPLVVEDLREGHVHVQIVLTNRIRDCSGIPFGQLVLRDDRLAVAELGGSAVAHADHLASPSAGDLVL